MMVSENLQKIFDKMPEALVPENSAGLNAAVQLNLTGEGAGHWVINFVDGTVRVDAGQTDVPNLSFSMTAADYVALSLGQVSPMGLFMGGKVQVQGDMSLAMKFPDLFDRKKVGG